MSDSESDKLNPPDPPKVPEHELLRCVGAGSHGEVWLARSVTGQYRAMRTYCAKHNKLDDAELIVRKIVQHYVLIAANSGLRVGEQRQLCWSDVQLERHSANGTEQTLARIHVRAETSKVRTSRTFLCRNGQYFERLREIAKPTNADELVFTIDGENQITQRTII